MSETVWEFRSVGPDEMQLDTTPGFTDAERAKLAEFEAAEEPEEIRVIRAVLEVAEDLERDADAAQEVCDGMPRTDENVRHYTAERRHARVASQAASAIRAALASAR